ncbi:MAG: hypothetical protein V3S69_00935 [Dehalococcoidales bacterium]
MATNDNEKFKNPGLLAKTQMKDAGVEFLAQDAMDKEFKMSSLLQSARTKVESAKLNRSKQESQWFKNTQAFKGIDTTKFRNSEENDVYLRTTAVKTRAAYSQIIEALLSDGRFPVEVTHTEVPFGISEYAHLSGEMAEMPDTEVGEADNEGGIGFAGDGKDLLPGATFKDFEEGNAFLGGLEGELTKGDGTTPMAAGPGHLGEPQIALAKQTARALDKLIQDHLTASKARTVLRKSIFECCLLGTGVVKGPFNVDKKLPRWVVDAETGKRTYEPVNITAPMFDSTSIWNLFIDPNANVQEDAEWMAERHRYTPAQLFDLKRRPHFKASEIDLLVADGGNYVEDSYEAQIRGNQTGTEVNNLFEVIEYWGYMPVSELKDYGLAIPEDAGDMVQVNMWYSGSRVLRVVINPFLPQRLPYFIFPYETRPYEMYGVGVPEAMEDSQRMINGFARLAVDNLALAGNVMMAVDDSALVHGQSDDIYPGKIWHIVSGTNASQAIQDIKFPNTAPENLQMMREFRQQADEATGIPSIAHGQTGVSGFGRTSSGMSMLLQNASLNIKTVIRNLDDHLFKPMGQATYQWEMQFSATQYPEIVGDLEIKATGSQSLQQKEVRSQRLQTFLQISANPALAPLIKFPTILKELAVSMDMDPAEILNNPDEAAIYTALMGQQNMQQPGQAGGMAAGAPLPTDPGFTGNDAGAGNPAGIGGGVAPEAAL